MIPEIAIEQNALGIREFEGNTKSMEKNSKQRNILDAGVKYHISAATKAAIHTYLDANQEAYAQLDINNTNDLIKRLMTKRVDSYFGPKNIAIWRDETTGKIISGPLGTDTPNNITDLILLKNASDCSLASEYSKREFLTRDEGYLASQIITSYPTTVRNNGKRSQEREAAEIMPHDDKTHPHETHAVQIPWVGIRLETVRNEDNSIANMEHQSADFQTFMQTDDDANEIEHELHQGGQVDGHIKEVSNCKLDIIKYESELKNRMRLVISASITNAKAAGKKAYIRFDGAGTGAWAGWASLQTTDGAQVTIGDVFSSCLKEVADEYTDREDIARIEGLYINDTLLNPNGKLVIHNFQKCEAEGRSMASKMDLVGLDENLSEKDFLLCTTFAWDGMSQLGNEGRWQEPEGRPAYKSLSNDPVGLNLGRGREIDYKQVFEKDRIVVYSQVRTYQEDSQGRVTELSGGDATAMQLRKAIDLAATNGENNSIHYKKRGCCSSISSCCSSLLACRKKNNAFTGDRDYTTLPEAPEVTISKTAADGQ